MEMATLTILAPYMVYNKTPSFTNVNEFIRERCEKFYLRKDLLGFYTAFIYEYNSFIYVNSMKDAYKYDY